MRTLNQSTSPDIVLLGRTIRRRITQVAVAVVLIILGGTFWMFQSFAQKRRIVIMDSSKNFYVAAAEDLNTSPDLHAFQTSLAMTTLFNRNPIGLDSPRRLELLFGKTALEKAKQLIKAQDGEYLTKQLHAKVEHGEIEILSIRDQTVRVSTHGQLIRNGSFHGREFTEALKVKAQFTFTLNANMITNGRFPTVVSDFDYELTPSPRS